MSSNYLSIYVHFTVLKVQYSSSTHSKTYELAFLFEKNKKYKQFTIGVESYALITFCAELRKSGAAGRTRGLTPSYFF